LCKEGRFPNLWYTQLLFKFRVPVQWHADGPGLGQN